MHLLKVYHRLFYQNITDNQSLDKSHKQFMYNEQLFINYFELYLDNHDIYNYNLF